MYDEEDILFALEAYEHFGSTRKACAWLGYPSPCTLSAWVRGEVPHERRRSKPRSAMMAVNETPATGAGAEREEAAMPSPTESEKKLYEPPKSGPLSGLSGDQIENLLLRAVLADLKAGGWVPASISNRSKCELGERLRLATGLPLRSITAFLRISKSSYEYHRARLGRDKYAELRAEIRELFEEGGRRWGYRTIWARLRREGVVVSEKVVRGIMRDEGLRVVYVRKKKAGWSSYEGEVSKAPENLVGRDFRAGAPDELWLTDITEFKPWKNGPKVYLSPVIDCFDGRPAAWSIGLHPTKELANSSLRAAVARMRAGAAPIIHSDRGGHYRWPEWIAICEENGLVRSMSAKGCSPDNAACEGFFGRLKNEFFYYRSWKGVTPERFMEELDAYMRYYCEGRIKQSLGWLSPDEYRRSFGYAS